ncbi:hypothetical protein B5K05_13265 [Rhizobium phaseoli]|nr:hypothetical protein B5K05_13265 [Rhizobium phaseoli]
MFYRTDRWRFSYKGEDVPCRRMWEARYWPAYYTILHQIGSSLEQWFGAANTKSPRHCSSKQRTASEPAVKFRTKLP